MAVLKPISITVFTGFLGAGKTSIILSLLPQLPQDYKVVLLKNEFGDVQVDSQLAKQSNLASVSEILNGCMCCVLVGQMENALLEIREKYRPDRIIIECSGSAFPATLAFQLRELERKTDYDLRLDGIVTVIDAENFVGYEDTSPTARMQASYTDIILINKWEQLNERDLDIVLDHLNTLNDLTPKIRCKGRQGVDPNLIFGLDSQLFLQQDATMDHTHNDEVETVTIYKGVTPPQHDHDHGHSHRAKEHIVSEPVNGHVGHQDSSAAMPIDRTQFETALGLLSKETIWRVKGFVRTATDRVEILNWAFGRYDFTPAPQDVGLSTGDAIKLTVMGERGEVKRSIRKFLQGIEGASII